MADILVLVPTYNEVDLLERTVGRIRQSLVQADVLIIDDSSPDGTGELAKRLAADDAGITALVRSERGYASAIGYGLQYAIANDYRFVVTTDADGSYDADVLPTLIEAAEDGVDLVIASRWVPGGDVRNMEGRRRLLSSLGNAYARFMLSTDVRDLTSSLRVYSTEVLRRVPLAKVRTDAYAFHIEMVTRIAQAQGRIAEVPVEYTERSLGSSKMHAAELFGAFGKITKWGLRGIKAQPRRVR